MNKETIINNLKALQPEKLSYFERLVLEDQGQYYQPDIASLADADCMDIYHRINDVAEHGCSGGSCSSLIYNDEIVIFHDKHEDDIWDILEQYAEDTGTTAIKMIDDICLKQTRCSASRILDIKLWAAWVAVEIVCQRLSDMLTGEIELSEVA